MRQVIDECTVYRSDAEGGRAGKATDSASTADVTTEGQAAALRHARAHPDAFLWLGLYEPSEAEFGAATAGLGLHPLAVEDALRAHQRPKLEVYADALVLVVQPVAYQSETGGTGVVERGEVLVFVGDSFVVTVVHGPRRLDPSRAVQGRFRAAPELLRHGPTAVLYALCDAVVDGYEEAAAALQVDLEELESVAFAPGDVTRAAPADGGERAGGVAERVYAFKRQVLAFRRATLPLATPAERLTGAGVPFVDGASREFFRDVHDHLVRVNEQTESVDRLLSDILSASLAQTSIRQNDEMRRISAWAAMVAVPTAIAGIYGMNFRHIPELHLPWAYPAVLLVMVGTCLALFRIFRGRGWM